LTAEGSYAEDRRGRGKTVGAQHAGPQNAYHLPTVTENIAISPSAPAIEAARIWRLRKRTNASGSCPPGPGSSRASLAAVGTLTATAPIAPSNPAPIMVPSQPGTCPDCMYGRARMNPESTTAIAPGATSSRCTAPISL